ncbi:MAG: hypothetical protein PWP08_292 [Methanofollis sp.]|nr:hypothetical protein [Methanofollis sp.]
MRGETLTDAIRYEKFEQLRLDFSGYIENNIAKIEDKLPVFYGYVVSALDSSFSDLDVESYDAFLDAISFKILDTTTRAGEAGYAEKVIESALRLKKGKNPQKGLEISVGLKMMKSGDFVHAIPYLRKYRSENILLHTGLAYCYYALSLNEVAKFRDQKVPSEMELRAREQMLELARTHTGVEQKLPFKVGPWLDRTFWLMISCAIEWFPSQSAFIRIGLMKAKADRNHEMRRQILDAAQTRFCDEMIFLRESFLFALEEGDGNSAASVVKQMIQHYPRSVEPFYYGMLLSFRTVTKSGYHTFRKQAAENGMPQYVLDLLDLSFSLFSGLEKESFVRLEDLKRKYPSNNYYLDLIRYLAHDIHAGDRSRANKAKKALLDSVDQCARQFMKFE